MINGQNHKGSTYHIAKMLTDAAGGNTEEFFMPKDFGKFCTGCTMCFEKDKTLCPHYDDILPIADAMHEADLIVLASPVYVYHCTGPMKSFLDHFGHQWIVHRPDPSMFSKQGVCISTAAGAGMKPANKDMADSLFFWGVGRIYKIGFAVHAVNWESVSGKQKEKIRKKIRRIASKIRKRSERTKPAFKTRAFFLLMRMLHKKGFSPVDDAYWKRQGWLDGDRPW